MQHLNDSVFCTKRPCSCIVANLAIAALPKKFSVCYTLQPPKPSSACHLWQATTQTTAAHWLVPSRAGKFAARQASHTFCKSDNRHPPCASASSEAGAPEGGMNQCMPRAVCTNLHSA